MARVHSVTQGFQDIGRHPSEVDCFVQIVEDDQERLVHVSSFGSSFRATAPKSSQSLQFNREQARALVQFFIEAFGEGFLAKQDAET